MLKCRLVLSWVANSTPSVYIIRNIKIVKIYVKHSNFAVLIATIHTNT